MAPRRRAAEKKKPAPKREKEVTTNAPAKRRKLAPKSDAEMPVAAGSTTESGKLPAKKTVEDISTLEIPISMIDPRLLDPNLMIASQTSNDMTATQKNPVITFANPPGYKATTKEDETASAALVAKSLYGPRPPPQSLLQRQCNDQMITSPDVTLRSLASSGGAGGLNRLSINQFDQTFQTPYYIPRTRTSNIAPPIQNPRRLPDIIPQPPTIPWHGPVMRANQALLHRQHMERAAASKSAPLVSNSSNPAGYPSNRGQAEHRGKELAASLGISTDELELLTNFPKISDSVYNNGLALIDDMYGQDTDTTLPSASSPFGGVVSHSHADIAESQPGLVTRSHSDMAASQPSLVNRPRVDNATQPDFSRHSRVEMAGLHTATAEHLLPNPTRQNDPSMKAQSSTSENMSSLPDRAQPAIMTEPEAYFAFINDEKLAAAPFVIEESPDLRVFAQKEGGDGQAQFTSGQPQRPSSSQCPGSVGSQQVPINNNPRIGEFGTQMQPPPPRRNVNVPAYFNLQAVAEMPPQPPAKKPFNDPRLWGLRYGNSEGSVAAAVNPSPVLGSVEQIRRNMEFLDSDPPMAFGGLQHPANFQPKNHPYETYDEAYERNLRELGSDGLGCEHNCMTTKGAWPMN